MAALQITPALAAEPGAAPAPTKSPPDPGRGPLGDGISISGMSKVYERRSGRELVRTHALAGVDLRVASQEFVSIIGPSGCGKSTVIKILGGLLAPTTGEVLVDGRRIDGPGRDRATVFQSPGLMPWRSVKDNVTLALEFAGLDKKTREARAEKYLELVGLGDFLGHYPAELSGGMQQRVGLARALAVEPSVLLMDEPFGALDAITRAHMQNELLRIWDQEKKTVVFITHAIDEALLLSDRVLVMNDGAITENVKVDMPRPRSRDMLYEDPQALATLRRLEKALEGEEA